MHSRLVQALHYLDGFVDRCEIRGLVLAHVLSGSGRTLADDHFDDLDVIARRSLQIWRRTEERATLLSQIHLLNRVNHLLLGRLISKQDLEDVFGRALYIEVVPQQLIEICVAEKDAAVFAYDAARLRLVVESHELLFGLGVGD